MGKGGGSKVEVTRYYMGLHFGVCAGPVDAMTRIIVKEKTAWEGSATAQTSFKIDKDQLFGGRLKEGGVEAIVYWLPGASDQVLPDHLAQRLGRSDGADTPGYRGLASVFFVGAKGTGFSNFEGGTEPRYGTYWSANNPYLPGVWITVRRAPVGLDPAYALVPDVVGVVTGEVELTWQQRSFNQTQDDFGRMGIAFINSSGSQIGAIDYAAYTNPIVWTERTHSATCPEGTATVRIYMSGDLNWGNHCDAYFDDIEATLDGVPLTITNPGAETGDMTGWTDAPDWVVRDSADGTGSPYAGTYYFGGARAGHPYAWQDVVQSNNGANANPAHIIYEALTNTDWGMGSPETAIDKAGFEAVAITLYGEAFGLSMIWTRQASIQDFIQEVLDHINAVLFVDPATGLLTLSLIRGDYDADTLAELTPSNSTVTSFSRKTWGEIANEIVVTWTNPESEQDETVTVQDLASIAAQGGIITDSRNYYGVRNSLLASRLAQRDLRSAGAPLAAFEIETDRSMWQLRPASVVKVTLPEYGLDGVVARVTNIEYGRPGDSAIKLSLIEDVFGLDFGDYVEPPSTGWEDPSELPEALTIERLFTLPYFMAVQSDVAAFVDTPEYPETVAGILGTTTQDDAYAYDVWDEVTLSNGDLEWQNLGTNNIIGHGELADALVAEATSTPVSFDNLIGDTGPTVAGFVIIGDEGDAGNEIAQIDDTDYTLRRGVLDTVPRAWTAGTPVWFVDDETAFGYPDVLAAGQTLDVKLLTRTSLGVLALADAALVSDTITDRPWLPTRPAKVEVDGVQFNTVVTPVDKRARTDPWVTISWANRNRLTEDSQVLGWTDATVTGETGQTTGIEVIGEDGTTVIDTITGISGTTHDVPNASFGGEAIVLIRPFGERSDDDGDFVSLQAHGIWVQVADGELVDEDGAHILGEDGSVLISEG